MIKAGSKLLVFGNSACEIYELTISWDKNGFCGFISTEGALREGVNEKKRFLSGIARIT